MLAIASFVIGIFATDILCRMAARRLNWRIIYDSGCEKCGKVSGLHINQGAGCLDCICIESDRRMAEYEAEQKILEEDLAVELKRIADEYAVERAEMDERFAAEQAENDRLYAEQTERTRKGWEEADARIKSGGDEC
jgi:hypothetical protein